MPADTRLAFADHGALCDTLPRDGGGSGAAQAKSGIDLTALAAQLQSDGAKGFVASWNDLLGAIEAKRKVLG